MLKITLDFSNLRTIRILSLKDTISFKYGVLVAHFVECTWNYSLSIFNHFLANILGLNFLLISGGIKKLRLEVSKILIIIYFREDSECFKFCEIPLAWYIQDIRVTNKYTLLYFLYDFPAWSLVVMDKNKVLI